MKVLVILGCSKRKLTHAARARDLYQGALFKAGLAYATRAGADVAILSAKYGVLHPDDLVEPYDLQMTIPLARQYAQQPAAQAELKDLVREYERIWVVAGKAYRILLNEVWDDRFHNAIVGGIGTTLRLLNTTGGKK